MSKYLSIFGLCFINSAKSGFKPVLIRSSFLLVIVFIFSKVWAVTPFKEGDLAPECLIWYLAVTELIVLSIPAVQVDVEADIRSGDVVYTLTRPVSYMGLKLSEMLGTLCFRLAFLCPLAFAQAYWLCGAWSPRLEYVGLTVFTAGLASTTLLLFHALIGLSAFRLQDSSPLFWLWQRSSFLLGGLILPLDFYPESLTALASYTPFTALIYAPAHLLVSPDASSAGAVIGMILFWGGLAFIGIQLSMTRVLRGISVNGG